MKNEMNKLINSSDTVFATFSKCTLEKYMRAHADFVSSFYMNTVFLLYFCISTQHCLYSTVLFRYSVLVFNNWSTGARKVL